MFKNKKKPQYGTLTCKTCKLKLPANEMIEHAGKHFCSRKCAAKASAHQPAEEVQVAAPGARAHIEEEKKVSTFRWFVGGYVKLMAAMAALSVVIAAVQYVADPPDDDAAAEWDAANSDRIADEEARLTALQAEITVLLEQRDYELAEVKLIGLRWDITLNNPHRGAIKNDIHEVKWNQVRFDLEGIIRKANQPANE